MWKVVRHIGEKKLVKEGKFLNEKQEKKSVEVKNMNWVRRLKSLPGMWTAAARDSEYKLKGSSTDLIVTSGTDEALTLS